jgi:hypothetical protein
MTAKHADHDALNKAYKAALQEGSGAPELPEHMKMGADIGGTITNVEQQFCAAWPQVKKFLNIAIMAASWWPGTAAVAKMAQAAITAIDKVVVPNICGTSG